MNYIVFDLEFNQVNSEIKENDNTLNKSYPFEIIQIGALKLDENLKTISTFNSLIKPTIYSSLNPYVESLTNLTMEDLINENNFEIVYNNFISFLGNEKNILCVWGNDDIKILIKNIKYHNLSFDLIPKTYINVQKYASKSLKYTASINISLKRAVELLNILITEDFHNAFNDAYYTSEIFKKIFTRNIIPQSYSYNHLRNNKISNKKLNTQDLYNQFEKMLDRALTSEEKHIIKVAYFMGKTHQFQK